MKKLPIKKKPAKQSARRAAARPVSPPVMIPGQYFLCAEPIEANVGKKTVDIDVANAGDRPVQVGSHFHFFEVNRALTFDRTCAYGMRLNIAAGTAVRFEPGQKKKVSLVALGGRREVWGLNGLVNGALKS
ncbi:MAG: urease subunit beta [Candidatus Binatia bacterium]